MAARVLIVEDDPAQRRILEEMIKRFGFEATSADSGAKGLDILAGPPGGQIELVILDLMMPGMDGLEFLEKHERACAAICRSSCRPRKARSRP